MAKREELRPEEKESVWGQRDVKEHRLQQHVKEAGQLKEAIKAATEEKIHKKDQMNAWMIYILI